MTNETPIYRPSTLFTVRIWEEESDGDEQEWRGTVRCLPDGQKHTFRGWPALIAFLEQMADSEGAVHG